MNHKVTVVCACCNSRVRQNACSDLNLIVPFWSETNPLSHSRGCCLTLVVAVSLSWLLSHSRGLLSHSRGCCLTPVVAVSLPWLLSHSRGCCLTLVVAVSLSWLLSHSHGCCLTLVSTEKLTSAFCVRQCVILWKWNHLVAHMWK